MEKADVFIQVSQILTAYLRLKPGDVRPESHVVRELGADSLALVELGFKFMEAFGIGMIAPDDEFLVIDRLVDVIVEQMQSRVVR